MENELASAASASEHVRETALILSSHCISSLRSTDIAGCIIKNYSLIFMLFTKLKKLSFS